MDLSTPSQTSTSNPSVTEGRPEAETTPPPPDGARKPYAPPRLTEHGRLAALTLTPSTPSDRNVKEGFEVVDRHSVLAAVARLPIERWSYKGEPIRHLGPMAQDFAAAFGLGADDRHIFPLDAAGVTLAAIQGLHGLVQVQAARIDTLEQQLNALRRDAVALRLEVALRESEPVA